MRRKGKIGVNLVCNDKNIMTAAYLCYLLQFGFCPNPAYWIMGGTQYQHLVVLIRCFSFQILKINVIPPLYKFKRVLDDFSLSTFYNYPEFKKDRRLDNDPVSFIRMLTDQN